MITFKRFTALLVLIITNAFVFTGIVWNRTGEPTGVMIFDQCELDSFTGWSPSNKSMRYVSLSSVSQQIDRDTLKKLYGFNPKIDEDEKWFERRLYVVLKQGGPEWKSYLEEIEQGADHKGYFRPPASKLIIVDGNVAPERLQEAFPDTEGRAILPGYIEYRYGGKDASKAYYWNLASNHIAIDSQYRDIVNEIRDTRVDLESDARIKMGLDYEDLPCTPTQRIMVKWGRRFEPWISSIEAIKK